MLIYISSEKNSRLLDDVCDEKQIVIQKIIKPTDIKKFVLSEMNNFSHITILAFDLSAAKNNDTEIIEAINAFRIIYTAKIVVVALDYSPSDELIIELSKSGVREIITGNGVDSLEINKKIESYIDENPDKRKESFMDKKINNGDENILQSSFEGNIDIENLKNQKIKIAVCGTQNRIGTTTQSLLITSFLNRNGCRACYVEANKNRHIEKILDFYDIKSNKNIGLIESPNAHLYYKNDLSYILSLDYDFFVMDCGVYENMNYEAFVMFDEKIIVCGAKAWEISNIDNVFKSAGSDKNLKFIFSFIPENEQENIRKLMRKFKNNTYFSHYTPFLYSETENPNDALCFDLLSEYVSKNRLGQYNEPKKKERSRRFFK